MTTNADLERLCNALSLPNVFYLFPPEVVFDQSPEDALFWCETKEEAQADIDSRCPPGAWIWEGPPPVSTDSAWIEPVLRAAGEKAGVHSVQIELPESPDPEDPPASHFLVEVIFADSGRCEHMGEGVSLPAAVFAALLQALDAGAFGVNTKGETNESR